MTISYYYKLFSDIPQSHLYKLIQKTDYNLKSITGQYIPVHGKLNINMSLPSLKIIAKIDFMIVDDIASSHPLIINSELLGNFSLQINLSHEKTFFSTIHPQHKIESYYVSEIERNYCYSHKITLYPKQQKKILFSVSPVSPYLPGDHLLLTQDYIPYHEQLNIKITPSLSELMLYGNDHVVEGLVQNMNLTIFTGQIKGTIQSANDMQIDLIPENTNDVESLLHSYKSKNITCLNECRLPYQSEFSIKSICFDSKITTTKSTSFQILNMDIHFPSHSKNLANPNCENNDVTDLTKALSEERYDIKESPIPNHELPKFYEKIKTIQLGFKSDCTINPDDLLPQGIEIPETLLSGPNDIILQEDYDPEIWPFIKDIFLDTYPNVISKHPLDRGKISETCGFYTIRLKDNVELPKMKKIYYENAFNSKMLKEVLEFLCKVKVISKANVEGGDIPCFSSPCFLVSRKDKQNSSARLVVDFRALNECIALEPIAISNFDMLLNQMRDACVFSTLDLKSAFQSIELTEDSKKLTLFSCMWGSFYFHTLCTGMASSPTALARFCDKIIHHSPVFDKNKKVQYDTKGFPIMVPNRLNNVLVYYDDILIFTLPKSTYKETLKEHFKLLKVVVGRLAWHNAKIETAKAQIAKSHISFLGWLIGNSFLQADPKRIDKIVNSPFPTSVKGMRSYLGTLNFLRNTLNFTVLRHFHHLTPLTSAKLQKYEPTEFQREIFKTINKTLTSGPLYSKIIIPGVPKVLLTDSASETYSQFGCILGQLVPAKRPVISVPPELNLDDACHRIIFDNKLPVKPITPLLPETDIPEYLLAINQSNPPEFLYLTDKTFGYGKHANNSLAITIQSLLTANKCATSFLSICSKMHDYIKEHIGYHQILQTDFKGDIVKMKQYLAELKLGNLFIDINLQIIQAFSVVIMRTVTIINSTKLCNSKQLISFNLGKEKTPFFILLYHINDAYFTRPTILDKHSSYNLAKHAGSFEIILYHSKAIPTPLQNKSIMQLELYALKESLKAVEKLVNQDETICCVDNKCLYYIFHNKTKQANKTIANWGEALATNHPNIKLAFIPTHENPSDFLTRVFQMSRNDIKSTKLPLYVDPLLNDNMPTNNIMTIADWIIWVKNNPQYLKEDTLSVKILKTKTKTISHLSAKPSCHYVSHISNEIKHTEINSKLQKLAYGQSFQPSYPYPNTININKTQKTLQKTKTLVLPLNVQHHHTDLIISALKSEILSSPPKLKFVNEKPKNKSLGSAISRNMSYKNATAVFNPIRALESILTTKTIIEEQQIEYKEIYEKCVTNNHVYTSKNFTYSLQQGLLYIKHMNSCIKMLLPTSLLNKYIALAHLITNHAGPKKMILNLINYYHTNLQKLCYKFANCCLACLLVNHHNRSQTLGTFPLDADVGEVLHLDLIESLGPSSGFQHILLIKCVISNFAMMFPVYEKTSLEFLHIFMNSVWPIFHPKALYCDNGSLFVSRKTTSTLALMGTSVIYSSAFTGAAHGAVESYVKLFKRIFKKLLSTEKTFNWSLLPPLISHLHNSTVNPKTGFSPYQLLFGPDHHLSSSFLDNNLPKLHPSIRNEKEGITKLHSKLKHILADAKEGLIKERDDRLTKLNKNKISKSFTVGMIVLVKDRSRILGSTKPLKTYFSNSPFVVLYTKPSTLILKRLSDNIIICRSKNDVKKYTPFDPIFNDLPEVIKNICKQSTFNLTQAQLLNLLKYDDLSFENFSHIDDLDDDSIEFITSLDNNSHANEVSDDQLERELLEEQDNDFRITRQNKPSILKQMREEYKPKDNNKLLRFSEH